MMCESKVVHFLNNQEMLLLMQNANFCINNLDSHLITMVLTSLYMHAIFSYIQLTVMQTFLCLYAYIHTNILLE